MIPRTEFIVNNLPYQVDDNRYQRFSVRKQAFATIGYETSGQLDIHCWMGKMFAKMEKNIKDQVAGKSRIKYALGFGGNALNLILGTFGDGMTNAQFLKWNPLNIPSFLYDNSLELEPEKLTELVKYAAKLYGSDLTGIAKLDKRWVYSEELFKPFVFEDVEQPVETDDKFIIPNTFDKAVVMAVAMNEEFIESSPGALAGAATYMGYSRMGILAISLAEFIRSLGYGAIPCMNDTALSIPLAIDAGLGELGRNGLLITPEYGPCVRLCKVLTNMPLLVDKPLKFGITDFCRQCLICARECPSGSISAGQETFEAVCENNNPGVKKWPVEADKCLRFWQANGTPCANCVAVCPFTRGFQATQCLECERCDNPDGCSLQLITFKRQEHGYIQLESWGDDPIINPLTRTGL